MEYIDEHYRDCLKTIQKKHSIYHKVLKRNVYKGRINMKPSNFDKESKMEEDLDEPENRR